VSQDYLDMARQVLDRLVVDCNNVPCGRVDDLAIEGDPGTQLEIREILIGVGPASARLPELARVIIQKVFGKRRIAIPWSEVTVITDHIKLKSSASDLGLDEARSFAFTIISSLPGAWKK
jgi:hypothetical protein